MKKNTALLSALLFVLTLTVSGLARAQDYLVEIVLFENLDPGNDAPYSGKLYYPMTGNAIGINSPAAVSAGFRSAAGSAGMNAIVGRLNSSGRYRVIDQLAWQQPGLAAAEARAIRLSYGSPMTVYVPADAVAEDGLITALQPGVIDSSIDLKPVSTHQLDGTVTISLGKYLHIDANLVMLNETGTDSARLRQHRRMRSKEIHYLDNPRFGLLVLITPVGNGA
ncbi:CsiV family protein [Granulosicoccaceae sp. 1_MG-2023]|nr:CsiV family protein [Granulosicoccaceae sp. 1_MG-2023]